MRRIVSVWLIDWPVTVWRRSATRARRPASPPDPALDPQNPFALILRNSRGAAVLYALNPAARRAGLRRGQTQADARAMIPHLICKPADPEADARALTALAVWAERWSPTVTVDAVNDAPVSAGAPATQQGDDGTSVRLATAAYFSDADGEALRYAPPVLKALQKKKLLEPIVRRLLEPFYRSAQFQAALAG